MPSSQPTPALAQPLLGASYTASRRLYLWGLAIISGIGLWFIKENRWEIDTQTIMGVVIMTLAAHPALLWAKRRHTWFPAFEISMLTCIPFYAIPLMAHHKELLFYPESVIIKSSGLVIVYILVGHLCFASWKRPPQVSRLFTTPVIPNGAYKSIPTGILISNFFLYSSRFTHIIPETFSKITAGAIIGISTLSIFISAQLWGKGLFNNGQKTFLVANIVLQGILLLSSLYLISTISMFALAIISYSMARRSVPWLPILIFLPIISILHLGKGQMRDQYWKENRQHERLRIEELPLFFSEWVGYGLQAERIGKYTHMRNDTILDRASLMHMLCLSVDRIPREKEYLKGESYSDILAVITPRILWKNKPSSLISTQRLAVYFNLISIESIGRVSIAFGMLAESYVNFGYIGVILLAALFGLGLKRLALSSIQAPQFSAIGILSILLTAWSLQIEQTAATWISSLLQVMIVCIGIPLAFKTFESREKTPD